MTNTANLSNVTAICNAVFTVAKTSIAFLGSEQWKMPEPETVTQFGFPFLVVSRPRLAYGMIAGKPAGAEVPREIMLDEFAWDFDVYAIYNFDPDSDTCYQSAVSAMVTLMQTFTVNDTLLDTCYSCDLVSPSVMDLHFVPGQHFVAAKVTIRAKEEVDIAYAA